MMTTSENKTQVPIFPNDSFPAPSVLTRENTEMVEAVPDMIFRYLQYECGYRNCKYQAPKVTWGELVAQDYPHFIELMSNDVPTDSNTFITLITQVKDEDQVKVRTSTKVRDTPDGLLQTQEDFLNLTCTHRGRMNGKTWRFVRDSDYAYFTWAVGNTMTRDTKTFLTFRECLLEAEKKLVDAAEKGQVKVPKGLKWRSSAA